MGAAGVVAGLVASVAGAVSAGLVASPDAIFVSAGLAGSGVVAGFEASVVAVVWLAVLLV